MGEFRLAARIAAASSESSGGARSYYYESLSEAELLNATGLLG